jgi:hypothetical protein
MRRHATRALFVLASVAAIGGCTSVSREDSRVRDNLTPELSTLSERPREVDNRMLITMDTNAREINNDLLRMWLLDRPSRLTRQPMPR